LHQLNVLVKKHAVEVNYFFSEEKHESCWIRSTSSKHSLCCCVFQPAVNRFGLQIVLTYLLTAMW